MARIIRMFVLWCEWWGNSTVWVFSVSIAWIRPTGCGRPEEALGVQRDRSSEALGRTRRPTDSKWLERQSHNISILTKKANNIDEFTVHLQCRCETFIKHWFWRMWKGDYKRSFFATFTIHCFLCNIHNTLSFQLQRNNGTGKPCVHTSMLKPLWSKSLFPFYSQRFTNSS